jgi:hypothetical protein
MTHSAQRTSAMSTLVQCVEVWDVDALGSSLQLTGHVRFRGNLMDFESPGRSVQSGEGLAGMAWHQRHAIILQESPSELLEQLGARNGLELSALVAFPIMRGQDVLSVLVLGISPGPGAFEVWSRDDRDELSISASYYSGLKSFELISRHVRFPKGAGLPGSVWKTGRSQLACNLVHSHGFMRSFAGDETELNTGLGLPVGSSAGNCDSVLLMLSSHAKPMARAMEVWQPGSGDHSSMDSAVLCCTAADRIGLGGSPESCLATGCISGAKDVISAAWDSGRPILTASTEPGVSSRTAAEDGVAPRVFLAVPIYRSTERAGVVLMVF